MSKSYISVIKKYISPKRVDHSIRVADTAVFLAKKYGANVALVEKAGLLHDIAKNQTPESLTSFGIDGERYRNIWEEYPAVWHAFVGPQLIEYEFPNESVEIREMVQCHTTGQRMMGLESKIIFISDFTEPLRQHAQRQAVADISEQDLNQAVAWITHYSIKKLSAKNAPIHPFTKDCWEYYCKYIVNSEKWHRNEY